MGCSSRSCSTRACECTLTLTLALALALALTPALALSLSLARTLAAPEPEPNPEPNPIPNPNCSPEPQQLEPEHTLAEECSGGPAGKSFGFSSPAALTPWAGLVVRPACGRAAPCAQPHHSGR